MSVYLTRQRVEELTPVPSGLRWVWTHYYWTLVRDGIPVANLAPVSGSHKRLGLAAHNIVRGFL